ncbi:MAG: flavoprotein [Candidatus Auribacterota bacterium]
MMSILKDKTILIGVTGSIAAYKACDLVSRLMDRGALPKVVMTKSAQKFIRPLSFESLTGEPVVTSMWKRTQAYRSTVHISLAQSVDCAVIAPASANCIAKVRLGLCDDILSCVLCAFDKPIIISPAMNDNMWKNPAVQENVAVLKERGVTFVEPGEGKLACGTVGKGRMADTETIITAIQTVLTRAS